MTDAVALTIISSIPAIITSIGALIVSVRSSRTTTRKVRTLETRQDAKELEIDTRLAACEKVRGAGPFSSVQQFHEHFAMEHMRAAIQETPDDMPQRKEPRDV